MLDMLEKDTINRETPNNYICVRVNVWQNKNSDLLAPVFINELKC